MHCNELNRIGVQQSEFTTIRFVQHFSRLIAEGLDVISTHPTHDQAIMGSRDEAFINSFGGLSFVSVCCYTNIYVTESLYSSFQRLIYRLIMFLVTQLQFFFNSFGLFCNSVDVSRSVYAYRLERSPSPLFSQIPCSVIRFNHVFFGSFTYLSFRYAQDWYFLRFFFPVRSFCYRVLSFLFSTPIFCKLGVTWVFILIPSNQDVMYLFYAFDSFPVT